MHPGGVFWPGYPPGCLGCFLGYPGRYPGEITGWPGEYPEVRLSRPRGSLYRRLKPTCCSFKLSNNKHRKGQLPCVVHCGYLYAPFFLWPLSCSLKRKRERKRERERERGALLLFLSSLEVARVVDPGLDFAPVQRLAPYCRAPPLARSFCSCR